MRSVTIAGIFFLADCRTTFYKGATMSRIAVLTVIFVAMTIGLRAQDETTEERPQFRTVPWTAWVSVGTTFDAYSVSVGLRREAFGAAFGYVRSFDINVPAYSAGPAPNGGVETVLQLQKLGLDLVLSTPMTDWLSGYAIVGGWVDINTVLVHDTATGSYYASPRNPDWTNPSVEIGAGLELSSLAPFVVGLGYHAARGFNIHVGYQF